MGRYRAPRPESTKYITPEGAARLRRELDELWRVKRPAVTRAVAEAAAPSDTGRVFFGAWFELTDDGGDSKEYRLVGPDEFDFAPAYVSIDSPLGRAVLGKPLDAEVVVRTPEGERSYEVTRVRYG